jgi:IclR family acetate operon transcriptional repressor
MASYVGNRNPLHSTAVGKVILAFLPARKQQAILAGYPLPRFTPHTITDPALLGDELARTRRQGYAVDNEENEIGARCIGVPILDSEGFPMAGLSISGPRSRISDEAIGQMVEQLWIASSEIARRLGYAHRHQTGSGD